MRQLNEFELEKAAGGFSMAGDDDWCEFACADSNYGGNGGYVPSSSDVQALYSNAGYDYVSPPAPQVTLSAQDALQCAGAVGGALLTAAAPEVLVFAAAGATGTCIPVGKYLNFLPPTTAKNPGFFGSARGL